MNKKFIMRGKRLRIFFTGILAFGLMTSMYSTAQNPTGYLNFKDLSTRIKSLTNSHSAVANLESIGKSAQGRDIWMVTLANPKGTPVDKRQGILVSANFEGDHLVGSSITIDMLASLLEAYGKDDAVTKSLDNYVFYFLPRMNPDGAELYFGSLKSGQKTNLTPYDGDNDGRVDEDGPDDLDNNGVITMMRLKDPSGEYMVDPDNHLLLKKADASKGEAAMYKVFWEGLDNDGDGFINEDPVGGVNLNRNFQHEYPYHQPDAGLYMISESESRALMDWIIVHRNIAIMLSFGESDNLITAPNSKGLLSSDRGIDMVSFANASTAGASKVGMVSTRRSFGRYGMGGFYFGGMGRSGQSQKSARSQRPARKAATTVNTGDLTYFSKVSKKYKELTGISKAPVLSDPKGAFFQYGYYQFGVLSLSTPGWGFPVKKDSTQKRQGMRRGGREAMAAGDKAMAMGKTGAGMPGRGGAPSHSKTKSGIDAEYFKYLKDNNIDGFVEWKSYNHPSLGEVEIGGFTPYEMSNPPVAQLANLGQEHADFVVYLSSLFAEVAIVKTEVTNHGDGLFRIKATVENKGFLPTALKHGVVSRSVAPTMVQLQVKPEAIISGDSKTNFIQVLEGSGSQKSYEWLIEGKKGDKIELTLVAPKAGSDKAIITLK